jgi:uncharacterized protein (TIGR02246 family)
MLSLIAIAFLSAVSPESKPSAATPSAVQIESDQRVEEPQIRNLIENQFERWNNHDLEGFLETIWKSPLFLSEVDGVFTFGWEKYSEKLRREYSDRTAMGQVTRDRIQINFVAPDIALTIDWWTTTTHQRQAHGFTVSTVEKFPEGWRIIIGKTFYENA